MTNTHPTNSDAVLDRLHAEAPTLHALLIEYLDPVLPPGFKSDLEWKRDFDTRVRCALLRIAGPEKLTKARAA